jgi:hypothetical protein
MPGAPDEDRIDSARCFNGNLSDQVRLVGVVEGDAVVVRQPSGRLAVTGALVTLREHSAAVSVGRSYSERGLSVSERRIDALLDGTSRRHLVTPPGRWVPSVVVLVALLCPLLLLPGRTCSLRDTLICANDLTACQPGHEDVPSPYPG